MSFFGSGFSPQLHPDQQTGTQLPCRFRLQLDFLSELAAFVPTHGVCTGTHSIGLARALKPTLSIRCFVWRKGIAKVGSAAMVHPVCLKIPSTHSAARLIRLLGSTELLACGRGDGGANHTAISPQVEEGPSHFAATSRRQPVHLRGSGIGSPKRGTMHQMTTSVSVLIDSERTSEQTALDKGRAAFVENMYETEIPLPCSRTPFQENLPD